MSARPKKTRPAVRISPPIHVLLKIHSARVGRTNNDLVDEAVERYLREEGAIDESVLKGAQAA